MAENKEQATGGDNEYYSRTVSIVAIFVILILLVAAAFGAYGSPFILIKYLLDGDKIAWQAVKVIFLYYIAGGFVVMWIFSWIYDSLTAEKTEKPEVKDAQKKKKKKKKPAAI